MRFTFAEAMTDPSYYLPLAQAAEAAGFDGFLVPDSICYPAESEATYPYTADEEAKTTRSTPAPRAATSVFSVPPFQYQQLEKAGIRTVHARIGLVVTPAGGAAT